MPEDSKKKTQKKNEWKDQRKPKTNKQRQSSYNKDKREATESEKESTANKEHNINPEFYQNLKRETDEILKITEEANSKYNKKEISSNWKKYEIPIESYDDVEEQESLGADYEKLIQTSTSSGGHFQFKHEKSWDTTITPSEYDKYFEINMDILTNALCTIPFYERNGIDATVFSEVEINTMKNRSIKYKQKYYNNKNFKTIEDILGGNLLKSISKDKVEENSEHNENLKSEHNENLKSKLRASASEVDMPTKMEIKDSILNVKDDEIHSDVIISNEPKMLLSNTAMEKEAPATLKELDKAPICSDSKQSTLESPEDLEKWLDEFLES